MKKFSRSRMRDISRKSRDVGQPDDEETQRDPDDEPPAAEENHQKETEIN